VPDHFAEEGWEDLTKCLAELDIKEDKLLDSVGPRYRCVHGPHGLTANIEERTRVKSELAYPRPLLLSVDRLAGGARLHQPVFAGGDH
jgi:hypothetical protein